MAFSAVSEAFLAKNLGGRYEPIGKAFDGSTITVPTGAADVPGLPDAIKETESHPTAEAHPTAETSEK